MNLPALNQNEKFHHECACCGVVGPAHYVKERKPGSTGFLAQCFWAEYWLCVGCIERADGMRGFECVNQLGRGHFVVVLAKTLAMLKMKRG